jgi:hypothetical protein
VSILTALRAALAIEHQVIYGYGVVGAHVHGRLQTSARDALTAHEERRDRLVRQIQRRGGRPPVAAPAYALSTPVDDGVTAARLGAQLEAAAAGALWDVIAASERQSEDRRLGVSWLAESTRLLDQWRLVAGAQDLVALPGQPS